MQTVRLAENVAPIENNETFSKLYSSNVAILAKLRMIRCRNVLRMYLG